MIKPRSAITRIGVGLAIAAGLSPRGFPLHRSRKRSLTPLRFLALLKTPIRELRPVRTMPIGHLVFNVPGRVQLATVKRMIPHRSIWISKVIREIRFGYIQTVRITQAVAAA